MFAEIGSVLNGLQGAYKLTRQVARGGMGAIFAADDLTHGRQVAIKEACLEPAICEGQRDQIRERLLLEMEVLRPLNHPNVPKIYDQFSSGYNEYLVMEFIQGNTLMEIQQDNLAQERQLDESRVVGWALQILDTLHYLHTRPMPIIHRDVKPENLILTPDGRVMLIDFGLMKQVENQLQASGPLIKAVGTVEYAPPEQYADSGATTDCRSDLYSLGATLYYLLAGGLPPKAVERMLPTSLNITRRLPSLQQANPTVCAHTERVITKALEIDPQQRYPSAAAMRNALLPPGRYLSLPF